MNDISCYIPYNETYYQSIIALVILIVFIGFYIHHLINNYKSTEED